LQRAARLVDLAKGKVTSAQIRLAEASRGVAEARADVERREAVWARAANAPSAVVTRVGELEQQSAHLRTLRLQVDLAKRRVGEALAVEVTCRQAVTDTSRERRKLELWLERLEAAERETGRRAEARADDEIAARTTRQRA
jgi:hypothetical protein